MKRILLLEDDLSLGETIKELLLENDYEVDVQ
jgi:two-component system, OmpR family, response regulator QseB